MMSANDPRSPAIDAATALALLRITLGTLFVWVFFENLGKGLYAPAGYAGLIQSYIDAGRAPAAWKAIMRVMAANARVAAPLQAAAEITFGVCLVLGLFTRPVALAAFGFLTSLWVSEWGTAWIWELLVPMMLALVLGLSDSGRRWAVDMMLVGRARARSIG
jgi:uncharacterized membrane protein YphA (DoxX/SURF4 family)